MTNQRAIKVINVFLGTDDLCACSEDKLHVSCNDCRKEAARMAIEALKEQQWIPCSERLPNNGCNVLICRKNGTVGEGCYHSILGEWSQFRWNVSGIKDVIAWMPLPEPYKLQESEDEL